MLYVLVRPFRFVEVLLQLQSCFSRFLLQVLRRIIRNLVKRQRIRVTLMLTRPLTDPEECSSSFSLPDTLSMPPQMQS